MSDIKQLKLVAEIEAKRERDCANNYRLAKNNVEQNRTKLNGLEDYRLNYLKMMQQKGKTGAYADNMNQHHSFVGKLDKACEQQTQFLNQASLAAEERKRQWLAQQRKRKAVEHLLEIKTNAIRSRQDKIEQQELDEFALQRFVRSNALSG